MKNTMCLALIILTVLPATAQKAAVSDGSTNGTDAIVQDYASCVDGLLREVYANLQKISVRIEAGELTPEQGRELKLATTRDMIARLDTLAAVYDARLNSKPNTSGLVTGPAADRAAPALASSGTVSVEGLKREGAK